MRGNLKYLQSFMRKARMAHGNPIFKVGAQALRHYGRQSMLNMGRGFKGMTGNLSIGVKTGFKNIIRKF